MKTLTEEKVETKANILEVFQSIQGEGKYAGVKQVFVRFFECNMHCVWCDTPHSIGRKLSFPSSALDSSTLLQDVQAGAA